MRRAASLASLATLASILAVASLTAPGAHAAGLLVPTDQHLGPLQVKHQRVEIDVKDGTSVTRVEQVFLNPTGRALEATYLFPVPTDAVMVDFKLMVGGVMKHGEVLPKDKANRIYSDIVRRMKDPGVLDWMSPNLFRARIYPVPARGEQRIELTYTQILPFTDGTYKLSYPLKTPGQTLARRDGPVRDGRAPRTRDDFTLTVRLHHHTPLRTIYSPTHKVALSRKGEHDATVGFEENDAALDHDFALFFSVSKDDVGLSLLTYRPSPSGADETPCPDGADCAKRRREPGYFLLMATPKEVFNAKELQGKAITFVVDTSGSMQGAKLRHAKRALAYCLDHLQPDDRFNVVRFSSDVERFTQGKGAGLVAASPDHIAEAKRFVEGFQAAGGTAIDAALTRALRTDVNQDTHLIVFLTDGRPTIGETAPKAILKHAAKTNADGKARLFLFGVGVDVQTHLMDQLAQAHHGAAAYVKPNQDIETDIAAFYNKIAFPVLSDIQVSLPGARAFSVLPEPIPDLFKGGQLILAGRYRGAGDSLIRVTGAMAGTQRTFDFEGSFPAHQEQNAFIAQIWAHRQVGALLDQIRLHGETRDLRQEVIQLATRYGIVTPYTSYLVTESQRQTARPDWRRRRNVPNQIDDMGGGFGGGGGNLKGLGGVGTSSASGVGLMQRRPHVSADRPAVAAAPAQEAAAAADCDAFRETTGRRAVDASKALKRYKQKKDARPDLATVRSVGPRTFTFRRGQWVDTRYRAGMTKIRVAPYSPAWLALGRHSKHLRAALALGDRVTLVLHGVAVVVEPGGATSLSDRDRKRLRL